MANVMSKWFNDCIVGSSASLSLVQFSPACGAVFGCCKLFSVTLMHRLIVSLWQALRSWLLASQHFSANATHCISGLCRRIHAIVKCKCPADRWLFLSACTSKLIVGFSANATHCISGLCRRIHAIVKCKCPADRWYLLRQGASRELPYFCEALDCSQSTLVAGHRGTHASFDVMGDVCEPKAQQTMDVYYVWKLVGTQLMGSWAILVVTVYCVVCQLLWNDFVHLRLLVHVLQLFVVNIRFQRSALVLLCHNVGEGFHQRACRSRWQVAHSALQGLTCKGWVSNASSYHIYVYIYIFALSPFLSLSLYIYMCINHV